MMQTNLQLDLAFNYLENTGTNIFLTGKAGTGKTTFLKKLKETSPKRMIVVAPTGVAAINAGGVTIHSFFQLPFGPYIPGSEMASGQNKSYSHKFSRDKINIIRSMDLLVIDEVSMVRADLLDAISDMLRRYRDRNKPFGGVQLLLIGDLQQLAPVAKEDEWNLLREHYASPFFFDSKALSESDYLCIELTQVYRQADDTFVRLLNNIRENRFDENTLHTLNQRYIPNFKPNDKAGYITLTTHNYQAQQINNRKLQELPGPAYTYKAEIKDDFPAYSYPTDEVLELKQDAQVMFVKNDSSGESGEEAERPGPAERAAAEGGTPSAGRTVPARHPPPHGPAGAAGQETPEAEPGKSVPAERAAAGEPAAPEEGQPETAPDTKASAESPSAEAGTDIVTIR